jgi:hypothetical protein
LERFYITKAKKDDAIGSHFNSAGHHQLDDVIIFVLDFVHHPPDLNTSTHVRLPKESTWIHRMCTHAPLGLNIMDNLSW